MGSLSQKLRSQIFGGVLGGSSQSTASAGVDLSRKTRSNTSTAHLDGMERNKYSFGTVQYPEDLGTNEFGHYMMFYIYQVKSSRYEGPQATGSNKKRGRGANYKKHKKAEGITSSAQAGYPVQVPKELHANDEISISGELKRSGRLKRTSDVISLYMPPNIKTSYKSNYKNSEAGLAGVLGQQLAGATSVSDMLAQLGTASTFNTLMSALEDTLKMKIAAGAA